MVVKNIQNYSVQKMDLQVKKLKVDASHTPMQDSFQNVLL